jgi:hypothetical protein
LPPLILRRAPHIGHEFRECGIARHAHLFAVVTTAKIAILARCEIP